MTQKLQEFTKHKLVRRQKNRVDKLKSLTKKKRNVQKKKLIDTWRENNINPIVEELIS